MQTATLPLDLIYEALHYESLEDLHNLLRNPAMFANRVRTKYLPTEPQSIDPDSQEANEAATLDEQSFSMATYVWTQLNPRERENLLQAITLLCGEEDSRDFQRVVTSRLM
jgi:hypothetical protein